MACNKLTYLLLFMAGTVPAIAQQSPKKAIAEGNKLYQSGAFEEAAKEYEAVANNPEWTGIATYNRANALFKQKKYKEAAELYNNLAQLESTPGKKAEVYHNLGNSLLKSNELEKSIKAYEQALRLNPQSEDTRYNLAYAKQLLKKQQQKQQQNQQQNQKEQQEEKKEQQEERQQQEQEQQEQEQEQQEQEQEQNQQQQKQQQEQQQRQEQQQQRYERKRAEKMLEALNEKEKNIQKKVKRAKGKAEKINIEKDW